LGRSLAHPIEIADSLPKRRVDLVVLDQGIDTTTAIGRMFFQILGAIAEFEHALMSERIMGGLAAARARGRSGGQKPKLGPWQVKLARQMYDETGEDGKRRYTVQQIADEFGVARPTIYRALTERAVPQLLETASALQHALSNLTLPQCTRGSIKAIMRDGARRTEEKQRALDTHLAAQRRTVAQELAALSDEELITTAEARTSLSHPYHEMEMQRRLKVAIQEQTAESVRARRAANRIGVALVVLTVVLVVLTIVLAARS
jgi:hypothetical protein